MDNYDFTKQDREKLWYYDRWVKSPIPIDCNDRLANEALYDNNAIWDWNPRMELIDTPPEPFELIPIGQYDGDDLLPSTVILDDSYIIYLAVENPEYNCEVII